MPSLLRRHACLTTPVVNPCSRNGSQSNRKIIPQSPLTPRAAAPAAACVAGRSTGQHMPPQQALKTNGNNAPPKPKTPRAVTLWRHACLTTPVVNPCSRNGSQSNRKIIPQSPLTPRAAAPAAACVAGRSTGQHMPPQQALKINGNNAPPNQKPPRAVTLWRHACLTTPVVNPCSRNGSQSNRKIIPQSPLTPRAAAPAAACVAGRSRGQHMLPQRLPVQPQKNPPNQKPLVPSLPRRHAWLAVPAANTCSRNGSQSKRKIIPPNQKPPRAVSPERVKQSPKQKPPRAVSPETARSPELTPSCRPLLRRHVARNPNPLVPSSPERVKESPSDIGATSKEKNNIVIPEFSAWLTLVLEQCRAENIRNLPRQRAPTPLFQNADPGRHAPCQSRAATTSPSQLSTSPPAFSVTAVAAPNVWNDGGEDSFTPPPAARRRRMAVPRPPFSPIIECDENCGF